MTLRLTPYLMVEGNAKEAIQFYEKTLDAKVLTIQTYGGMSEGSNSVMPDAAKNLVAHALLKVGESDLMISDVYPGQPHHKGNHVSICITIRGVEKTRQVFEAMHQDGQVNHPLEETVFSPAFGTITDKFGVNFVIVADGQQ